MAEFSKENTFSRAAIGRRLRQIRGELTCQAFAARLGVSPGFINEIEHGRKKPSAELLFALEARYGVDANWVLRGGTPAQRVQESPPPYGRALPPDPTGATVLYRLDPAGSLREAGGTGLRLPAEWSGPHVMAVSVMDDSMAPIVRAGAIVGVDRRRTRVREGELALVETSHTPIPKTLVRRIYRTKGSVRLRADNGQVAEIVVPARRFRVLGQVVWILHRLHSEPADLP